MSKRKDWICGNCGITVSGDHRICNKCGTPHMMAAVQCPNCGGDSRFANDTCIHCGADLREQKAGYMLFETNEAIFRTALVNRRMCELQNICTLVMAGAFVVTGVALSHKLNAIMLASGIVLIGALVVWVIALLVKFISAQRVYKHAMAAIGFEKKPIGYEFVADHDITMSEAAAKQLDILKNSDA